MIKALIFDLDGVIVDTARFHFQSWKQLSAELNFSIPDSLDEDLKGLGRMESLDKVLAYRPVPTTDQEKVQLAKHKNDMYLENISHLTDGDTLPGVIPFLEKAKEAGLLLGIGSGSRNARPILERLGISSMFNAVCDGTDITRSKPDPQVFNCALESLGVDSSEAIVFEDATSGVEAAIKAGVFVIGLGDPAVLGNANVVLPSLIDQDPAGIIKLVG